MTIATHLVTLAVATATAADHDQVLQDFSELAKNLDEAHPYVSVSSQPVLDTEDDVIEQVPENLHYDGDTLNKVFEAMARYGLKERAITDLITNIQNAGILFRERGR